MRANNTSKSARKLASSARTFSGDSRAREVKNGGPTPESEGIAARDAALKAGAPGTPRSGAQAPRAISEVAAYLWGLRDGAFRSGEGKRAGTLQLQALNRAALKGLQAEPASGGAEAARAVTRSHLRVACATGYTKCEAVGRNHCPDG